MSQSSDRHDVQNRPESVANAGKRAKTADLVDRRRHARYRFSEPLEVCCQDGACLDGVSVELSESGMSAMIRGVLQPGDVVRLQPVAGVITAAVVRHKLGMLYGFEFSNSLARKLGKSPSDVANASRGGRVRGATEP